MGFPSTIYGICDELPGERSGAVFSIEGSRSYTRRFLVELKGGLENGKGFGPIAACSHPSLPLAYAPYYSYNNGEWDLLALLVRYEAVPKDKEDWTFWIVTATYSTVTPEGGQFQQPPTGSLAGPGNTGETPSNNPELEYPDIQWGFEDIQRAVSVDGNRKPYINSVGQPLTPAYTRPRAYRVLSITRNELGFNSQKAEEYAYALNNKEFLGVPKGFVQCLPPQAVQKFRGPYAYWRVSYKLRFYPRGYFIKGYPGKALVEPLEEREQNWQPAIQDQGFCKKGTNGKPTQILGPNGHPITQQVLLDGTGQPQTDRDAFGQLIPIHLFFDEFPYKDMTTLINRGFS